MMGWGRLRFVIFLALASLIPLVYALTHPLIDFAVYWSASHLYVAHLNPYSLPAVFANQKSLGWGGPIPIMFLSPPWMLPAISPLGRAQNYFLAWIVWFAILTIAVAISSRVLMDIYFGEMKLPEISEPVRYRYLFAFTFYPVLLSLKMSQLGALLLLGSAGFIYFERNHRHILAGLALSLTLMKPHLFVLLWLALMLKRQWRTIGAIATVCGVFSLLALWNDHNVFSEYVELMRGYYPRIVYSGMLAGLRNAFRTHDTTWMQALPPICGLIWFAFYWRRNKAETWAETMPSLILASLFFAPYGFIHDQSLLMVPIIFLAAESARRFGRIPLGIAAAYTALNVSILAVAMYSTPWCVVLGPIGVALYLQCRKWFYAAPVHLRTNTDAQSSIAYATKP